MRKQGEALIVAVAIVVSDREHKSATQMLLNQMTYWNVTFTVNGIIYNRDFHSRVVPRMVPQTKPM